MEKGSLALRCRDEIQRLYLYCRGLRKSKDDCPIYFFHHLPKCGGTSVRHALGAWFHILNDYRYNVEDAMPSAVRLEKLPPDCCVCGHFPPPEFSLDRRYPGVFSSSRYRIFTFIRHPLHLKLSLYKYEKQRGAEMAQLQNHLFERPNYLASRLQIETASQIPNILNRYFFIGQLEYVQESFDLLASRIGKESIQVSKRNVSRDLGKNLPKDMIQEFEEKNGLDYQIYKAVTKRNRGLV